MNKLLVLKKDDVGTHAQPNIRLTQAFLAGTLLIVSATLIRVICYNELGRHFTYELSMQKDHTLVTTGPYSIVRHPSYTGVLLFMVGVSLTQRSAGSWWVEYAMWNSKLGQAAGVMWMIVVCGGIGLTLSRGEKEDDVLRSESKDEWVARSCATPYSLIPGV